MVYMIVKNISQFKATQPLGIQLKKEILSHYEKIFGSMKTVTLLGIAIVLDPRFKKIYLKNPLALSKTLKYIADEIRQNQDLSESSSDNDKNIPVMKTSKNK